MLCVSTAFLCYLQLTDNSEALAHQRLATKLLAAKMKEMERDSSAFSSKALQIETRMVQLWLKVLKSTVKL